MLLLLILLGIILALWLQVKRQQAVIAKLKKTTTLPDSPLISKELQQELIDLKYSGHAIKAIKVLREHTLFGLQEAKEYVDSL